jgi:hypothetical protein
MTTLPELPTKEPYDVVDPLLKVLEGEFNKHHPFAVSPKPAGFAAPML